MLKILTKQGYDLYVPDKLDNSSTYILLEKEEWFERELPFLCRWLKPGMRVVDVGANLGVYTLAASAAVGAEGRVFSIEPGAHPRRFLEASCRDAVSNNVEIIPLAVADFDGEGCLQGDDSELASLVQCADAGKTIETVPVARLDTLADRFGWHDIALLKVDVEGGEHMVISGGTSFLSKTSPIVMLEFRADGKCDERARVALEALDYRIYRVLGNGEFLVPAASCESLPVLDLNLFAVKGGRIRELEAGGLLVDSEQEIDAADMADLVELDTWLASPFAASLEISREDFSDCLQDRILLNFLVSRNHKAPSRIRYGALLWAWSASKSIVATSPSLSQWFVHSRIAWELGYVTEALESNRCANKLIRAEAISGLFLPPLQRFDDIAIEPGSELEWFSCALGEQAIGCIAHSTAFEPRLEESLSVLCTNRYATPEMARSLILRKLWNGSVIDVPDELWEVASRGLNAWIWQPASWGAEAGAIHLDPVWSGSV